MSDTPVVHVTVCCSESGYIYQGLVARGLFAEKLKEALAPHGFNLAYILTDDYDLDTTDDFSDQALPMHIGNVGDYWLATALVIGSEAYGEVGLEIINK